MLVLLSLVSSLVLARQGGHHGHRRPVTGGYSTPQSGAGGLGSLLDGVQVRSTEGWFNFTRKDPSNRPSVKMVKHRLHVCTPAALLFQLNLLDAKLIGLGYVREDLVRQLCHQATQQVIWEGVRR